LSRASEPGGFLEAAVAVLSDSGHPMTAGEITAQALERGLLRSSGKTPVASMTARLYVHARDAERPRVRRVFEPGRVRAQRNFRHLSTTAKSSSSPRT